MAAADNVTLVDLYALSTRLLQGMTQDQADTFDALAHSDAAVENGAAKPDRTHLNTKGQQLFGRMVADEAARLEVELGPNIEGVPKHIPAAPTPAPASGNPVASPPSTVPTHVSVSGSVTSTPSRKLTSSVHRV